MKYMSVDCWPKMCQYIPHVQIKRCHFIDVNMGHWHFSHYFHDLQYTKDRGKLLYVHQQKSNLPIKQRESTEHNKSLYEIHYDAIYQGCFS